MRWGIPVLLCLLLWPAPSPAQTAQVELTGYGFIATEGERQNSTDDPYVYTAEEAWVERTTDDILIQGKTCFGIQVDIKADEGEIVQCTDRLIYPVYLPDGRVQILDEPLPEQFNGPHGTTSYYTVVPSNPVPAGDYTFLYDCGENMVQRTLHVRYPK